MLDTLAAAHAEAGNFLGAIRSERAALEDVRFAQAFGVAARERLRLYEADQAYHER